MEEDIAVCRLIGNIRYVKEAQIELVRYSILIKDALRNFCLIGPNREFLRHVIKVVDPLDLFLVESIVHHFLDAELVGFNHTSRDVWYDLRYSVC